MPGSLGSFLNELHRCLEDWHLGVPTALRSVIMVGM
jgi:hypothetical protein